MPPKRTRITNMPTQEGTPIESAISGFLQEKRFSPSPSTPVYYDDQIGKNFLNGMLAQGVTVVEAITPVHLRTYLAEQQVSTHVKAGVTKTISQNTVRQRQTSAKTFLRWCVNQDIIPASPMTKVITIKKIEAARVGYTQPEERRLVTASAEANGWLGARDAAIVALLLTTGSRAGGLVPTRGFPNGGVTEAAFDFTRNRVHVTEKGQKDRYPDLGKKTIALVQAYLKVRPKSAETDKLFISSRGTAFNYGGLCTMLERLGEYANIEGPCTAHRFRHTFAVNHYNKYHDMEALMRALGHTKIDVTQIYLRTLGLDERKAHYAPVEDW